jgi:integrase
MGGARKQGGAWEGPLPPGVEVRQGPRGYAIRIVFMYRSVRCREIIRRTEDPPTKPEITYAQRKRAEVLVAIEEKRFVYTDPQFFPESPVAAKFGFTRVAGGRRTVAQALDAFDIEAKQNFEPSTYRGYKSAIRALKPKWGSYALGDLNSSELHDWIVGLDLTKKRIRNILIPMRTVLERAVLYKELAADPLAPIKLRKVLRKSKRESDYEVRPFTAEERAKILAAARYPQLANMADTWWWSGLRHEEIIALEWANVDFVRGVIRVCQVNCEGKILARTKTKAGMRDVLMLPRARAALKRQEAYTRFQGRMVFLNPRTKEPWRDVSTLTGNQWPTLLRHAGVDYRGPNQCRHTYASMLIARGEDLNWIAKQMGHKDVEMLFRHYGKLIEDRSAVTGYIPRHDWASES